MAAGGGYNAPGLEDTRTGFGSESANGGESYERNLPGISNQPLFGTDYKRHEDLKNMLDSSKDSQKLEAMKIIVGMVAKGKDCADLFPAVVKNVVSKNSEIKKLVYVYLVRYAEEQQDVALLSISTFQKALKDPNQLIRASALRVLSSIRVPIIAPIMMLSIKDSVMDMSPYVRKTAAHAIPKLYSLDPEQKDQLVEIIEKLLKDQTTLVAGSVVMAFETVCPERTDLIHKNYRKLCNLLVDVDEWGQVMILSMLTRYARSQFVDPNKEELSDAPFYSDDDKGSDDEDEDDDSEDDSEGEGKKKKAPKKKPYVMDSDHRLLLRNCKPLLQSRNASVVMGVARLYHHLAPKNEMGIIAKPLIRLLKSHSEVQMIVLANIATMSAERPSMFEPYLKSFFVHSHDPTNIKLLKLEIIANVAGETSIHAILKEFRTYISSSDKAFTAATIEAIGRVACSISEVTETCLHGLMSLLSHKDETVVGESVVVIKKLLQLHPKENKDLIIQVARLTDKVSVPMAKASIYWLVGEYCSLVPKIAPDVLRKAAKAFPNEEDIVKLQTVNLAAKLCIANAKQSKPLCQYVLNMAKYDQNYDIRDRARFLRQLVLPSEATALSKYAKKILLAAKPAPVLESAYKGRSVWQVGSLSHAINAEASGYLPLPDFPEEAPDPSVRDVEDNNAFWSHRPGSGTSRKKTEEEGSDFYSSISGSEESGSETESETESGSESGSESEEEDSESGSEEEEEEEEEEETEGETSSDEGDALESLQKRFGVSKPAKKKVESSEESSEENSEDSESDEESDTTEEAETPPPTRSKAKGKTTAAPVTTASKKKQSNGTGGADSLLDLDDWGVAGPSSGTPAATMGGDLLTPLSAGLEGLTVNGKSQPSYQVAGPSYVPEKSYELLNRITGGGLQVRYKFTRRPHISSEKMLAIELTFKNTSDSPLSNIMIGEARLQSGMSMRDTNGINQLAPGSTATLTLGVDFNDTLQPAKFDICVGSNKKYPVQIEPQAGELIRAVSMTEASFNSLLDNLKGMYESSGKLPDATVDAIKSAVREVANMSQVASTDVQTLRFAGATFASSLPVLLTLQLGSKVTVNSEKMVINSVLLKTIKEAIGHS